MDRARFGFDPPIHHDIGQMAMELTRERAITTTAMRGKKWRGLVHLARRQTDFARQKSLRHLHEGTAIIQPIDPDLMIAAPAKMKPETRPDMLRRRCGAGKQARKAVMSGATALVFAKIGARECASRFEHEFTRPTS